MLEYILRELRAHHTDPKKPNTLAPPIKATTPRTALRPRAQITGQTPKKPS